MSAETEIVLDIRDVSKSFGQTKAVDKINLQIHRGEIYALIGPNGSGKTTLLKMMVGLLKPNQGEIIVLANRVDGDNVETKSETGYVPDKPEGYPYLTGNEFIKLTTRLRGGSAKEAQQIASSLVKAFDIEPVLREQMEGYSRGSLQKTAFIAALAGSPSLLIIDEPIAGLDPLSIKVFGETLKKFAKAGGTVLMVTHTLSFAQDYADRVGVMVKGKLVKEVKGSNNVQRAYDTST